MDPKKPIIKCSIICANKSTPDGYNYDIKKTHCSGQLSTDSLLHVVMACVHLLPPQHLHGHVHRVGGHVGRKAPL